MEPTPRATADTWMPYTTIIAALAIVLYFFPVKVGSFGAIDFVQYWSAWNLMSQGQNPYDPALLHNAQSALSSEPLPLIYSWNPPWTFTLLAPFLLPSLTTGATLWCLFQLSALFFIAMKTPEALKIPNLGTVRGAAVVLFFLPSLYALYYGQLGVLFALSWVCFLLTLQGKRYTLAGASLLPLTIKPHLFILCAIPALLWLTQIPRAAAVRFIVGSVGGFTVLVGATLTIAPSSLSWWLGAMFSQNSGYPHMIHFQQWMTHTTTTALRLALIQGYGVNPTWPLFVVPTGAFLLVALYFFARRPLVNWPSLLPVMLCVSLGTSSYTWVYDQPVLALCQYLLVAHAFSGHRGVVSYSLLVGCVSTQFVPLILIATDHFPGYLFFLMPWVFLALMLLATSWRKEAVPHSPES